VDSSQSVTYDDNVAYDELSSASLQDSELHQLFIAIQGAVTQLFRLSMMIRKKPKKDDYARAVDTVLMDPISDINHVKDKHPILREGRLWLAERLGRAITSCRQYFIYRRDHQEKLTAVHHLRTDEDGNTLWSGTRASTYYNDELPGNFVGTQYLPPQHPARTTATTEYADSSKGTEGSTTSFKTPPLPLNPTGVRYKFGDHFECPYCWRPQEIKSKTEWK
jgi:ligand-binding sensor domain-containing protein